jgi:AcrR family transcriptional regulator
VAIGSKGPSCNKPKEQQLIVNDQPTKRLPKQARAKARVEAILEAASHLLEKSGRGEITTTAIARAANIPVGSLYQYFTDKNDILEQLYDTAYHEVEAQVEAEQANLDPGLGFEAIAHALLQRLWQAARAHGTFKALTRWANREHSFTEVATDTDRRLTHTIERILALTGPSSIPAERYEAVTRTTVSVVSVLVDCAIEENDEAKAQALINELTTLLTRYLA